MRRGWRGGRGKRRERRRGKGREGGGGRAEMIRWRMERRIEKER